MSMRNCSSFAVGDILIFVFKIVRTGVSGLSTNAEVAKVM